MKSMLSFISLSLVCIISANAQSDFAHRLSEAAIALTDREVMYDPSYFTIAYPGGDVPADRGVCTDVVIRAYRRWASICKCSCMRI
jgi:uncharacterized protein